MLVGAGANRGVSQPLGHGQGLYHLGHALVHNNVLSPDPSLGQGRGQGPGPGRHTQCIARILLVAGAGAYHSLIHLWESLTGVHLQLQVVINSKLEWSSVLKPCGIIFI